MRADEKLGYSMRGRKCWRSVLLQLVSFLLLFSSYTISSNGMPFRISGEARWYCGIGVPSDMLFFISFSIFLYFYAIGLLSVFIS